MDGFRWTDGTVNMSLGRGEGMEITTANRVYLASLFHVRNVTFLSQITNHSNRVFCDGKLYY